MSRPKPPLFIEQVNRGAGGDVSAGGFNKVKDVVHLNKTTNYTTGERTVHLVLHCYRYLILIDINTNLFAHTMFRITEPL